jgi:hypothetical protein
VCTHWAEDAPRSSPSPEAADGVAAAGQGVWSDLQHLTQAALFGDERQCATEAPSLHKHGAQQHSRQVGHSWFRMIAAGVLDPVNAVKACAVSAWVIGHYFLPFGCAEPRIACTAACA